VNITCEVQDESAVFPPDLFWRREGERAYKKVKMHATGGRGFEYTLPATTEPYEYYFVAFDEYGNEGHGGEDFAPNRVEPKAKAEPPRRAARPPRPKPPPSEKRDTKPPQVEVVPVDKAVRGEAIRIEAAVDDESDVIARLWVRPFGATTAFRGIAMDCDASGYCTGDIPALYVTEDLEFYVEAADKVGNLGRDGSRELPKRIRLEEPAPAAATTAARPPAPMRPLPPLFLGRTWTWIAAGGAVVLLATGAIVHAATASSGVSPGAFVFYGLGAVAAGGAVVLWFVEEPQVPLEPLTVAPAALPGGAGVIVVARF
jgi:hypothetical protein